MGRESECILPLKVYAVPSFFGGPRTVLGCFCYCSDKDMPLAKSGNAFFAIFANQESKKNHYEEIHYSYDCCACCGVL